MGDNYGRDNNGRVNRGQDNRGGIIERGTKEEAL
jgi:hypothetical protein